MSANKFSRPRLIGGDSLLSFGGVYGNLQSLRALAAAESDIPAKAAVCAGDLAAYCADGAMVCEIIRAHWQSAAIVRGNCERAIAANEDECGCGFAPGSACDRLSAQWYPHAKKSIAAADRKWMGELPPVIFLQFGGRKIALLHAAADSDNQFIFASSPADEKRAILKKLNVDAVIAGHSGIPFTQNLGGGGIWHNSGALGMPANDGTPRVWYAKWTLQTDGICITHCALHYDFAAAQNAMRDANLSPDYCRALQNGIWPSNEVLPAAERRQQGIAISPQTFFWARQN